MNCRGSGRYKREIVTHNDKIAEFLESKGGRVLVLYEGDGVKCYKITLRGREQCRHVKTDEYTALAAANTLDSFRVVKARLTPPLFTVTVNGVVGEVTAEDGSNLIPFCRSGDFLTKIITPPTGELPVGTAVIELTTWEQVAHELRAAGKTDGVRVFVGYGPYSETPYMENYPMNLALGVAEAIVGAARGEPAQEQPPTTVESGRDDHP